MVTQEYDAVYAVRGDLIHLAVPGEQRKTMCGRVQRGGGCCPMGGDDWCTACDKAADKREKAHT